MYFLPAETVKETTEQVLVACWNDDCPMFEVEQEMTAEVRFWSDGDYTIEFTCPKCETTDDREGHDSPNYA
jgi:hypothetical protein